MPRYVVEVHVTDPYELVVEAASAEEAQRLAERWGGERSSVAEEEWILSWERVDSPAVEVVNWREVDDG